jgi:hypothetical protein
MTSLGLLQRTQGMKRHWKIRTGKEANPAASPGVLHDSLCVLAKKMDKAT